MVDRTTIEIYERHAREWMAARTPQDTDHVAWVGRERKPGPVVDIGCGPGWNLTPLDPPVVALDASRSMLDLVPEQAPAAMRIQASAETLPFARGALGGAVANRVLLHLPRATVPRAMADLHRALAIDAPAFVRVIGHRNGGDRRGDGALAGRLFSSWADGEFEDICIGAGFEIEEADPGPDDVARDDWWVRIRLRRALTLADTVGDGMRLLVCGLNPSIHAAEAGVGFARPGNRFWPAALAAGLVGVDRDPVRALVVDRVGMTDLVKRATRRADELDRAEYREGMDRLERLVARHRPAAVCFVGLAGWRAAVDRRAVAGRQERTIGGRPVHLMPSTSGLNAHASLDDLTDHLRAAARLADSAQG